MSISNTVILAISKFAPTLGTLLGGPLGSLFGSLVSSALGGVDMKNKDDVLKKLDSEDTQQKLKELELQFSDLKSARLSAEHEKGAKWWFRPFMVVLAYFSLFVDVGLIYFIDNDTIRQILILFTGVLILDIRQMHKLYFGSSNSPDENISLLSRLFKRT